MFLLTSSQIFYDRYKLFSQKAEYTIMFMNYTLRKHIVETDKLAKERFEILMKQMLGKYPIDENRKNTNPLR